MPVKIYKSKISLKEEIAKDTFLIRINLPDGDLIDFQPGQFVNILVAPNIRRSYSLANSPSSNTYVEILGDSVIGGPGSLFFKNSQVGDDVEFLGALGQFTYKEDPKPVYFFSTGTGVVPFISMITYALETLKTQRKIKLFLGFRHEESVFYKEYFENLASKYPNFEFILTLSQPNESWQGKKGRITTHYEQVVSSDPNIDAYICGSMKVIDDVYARLLSLGVSKERIFYEKYY